MKRRRVLYLVAGIALLAAVFIIFSSGPKEPVYQGKPITQWINEANDVGIFEQTDETKAAMTAFGTNAVPFLLNEFTRPISRRRGRVCAWINSLPFFGIHLRTDEERVHLAGNGLMLLETNAAPAMPVLARYLDDPFRDIFVISIFYEHGDAALPYLTAAFSSTNAVAIANVLNMLKNMAHRSAAAREVFAAALHHPSPTVRDAAVESWCDVLESQMVVVSRIVSWASDPNPLVRQAASNQLVWLGQQPGNPYGAEAAEALRKLQTNAVPLSTP